MNLQKIGLKRLDTYIIWKFLGTFFFSIVVILSIAVVFDVTEKIDDFYEHNANLHAIVFDYYLSFLPYYAYLFTPLFTFISVIFFTSKMANDTGIAASLASGVSFNRLMRPYFIASMIITVFAFLLGAFVIPSSTEKLIDFEKKYIEPEKASNNARNVQMEVEKGVVLYIERFDITDNTGYRFSLEKFEDKTLVSRITAETVKWDSLYNWKLLNYVQRDFNGMREKLVRGASKDITIKVLPKELFITATEAPQLSLTELRNIQAFEDEYYRRFSTAISVLVMTLIGVSLSSRKVRGGMGLNLGIGLGLSGLYVIFTTMSTTFAVNGVMPTLLAVWIPNITFFIVAVYLFIRAPK